MIMTKQYIKLDTGAKEIKQVNPGWPKNSQSISRIDKTLSRNYHRV